MGPLRHHLVFLYFEWTKVNTLITFSLYFAHCEDFLKSLWITQGGVVGAQAVVPVVVVANSIQIIAHAVLRHMGNSTVRRHLLHWVNIALSLLAGGLFIPTMFSTDEFSVRAPFTLTGWREMWAHARICVAVFTTRCPHLSSVSHTEGLLESTGVKYTLQSALCSQCPHHS